MASSIPVGIIPMCVVIYDSGRLWKMVKDVFWPEHVTGFEHDRVSGFSISKLIVHAPLWPPVQVQVRKLDTLQAFPL